MERRRPGKREMNLVMILLAGFMAVFFLTRFNHVEGAFDFADPNRMLVTVWEIVIAGAILFGVLTLFPSFRREMGIERESLRWPERIWLLLCFTFYLLWALSFHSTAYGPDETMREAIPAYIFRTGALPFGWEESLRDPDWGISYGFNIELPYLTSAYAMHLVSLFTDDAKSLFIASRLTSVLSMTGVAYYAIRISRKLFGDHPARWILIVSLSMLPQLVFISSYTNLDAFSLLVAVAVIDGWIRCLEAHWDRRSCVRLAVALGLCFLAYEFIYSYLLMSALLYCVWYLMNRKEMPLKTFLLRGGMILGIVFLIAGWKLIRNGILYQGDILSLNASAPYAEQFAVERLRPSFRKAASYAGNGIGLIGMLQQQPWLEMVAKSLIGVFGYMFLFFDGWIYWVYAAVIGLGLMLAVAPKWKKPDGNSLLLGLAMAGAALVTFFISLYFSWTSDYQPQGRYVISILPALFVAVTAGYRRLSDGIGKVLKTSTGIVRWGPTGCICGWVIFSAVAGYMACLGIYVH